jgi:hypothetical protein
MRSKGPGWANPWHLDTKPGRLPAHNTWHHYASEHDGQLSTCGQWRYEVLVDHALTDLPDGAKRCLTCQRLATKEPANATP